MSEKRKPKIILLLQFKANETTQKHRIELYEASLFTKYDKHKKLYRMRIDRKWWPKGTHKYFYKTQIRDILWRSIPFN